MWHPWPHNAVERTAHTQARSVGRRSPEALSLIQVERNDDILLLLAQLERMQVAALLDKHFPTHGLGRGVDFRRSGHGLAGLHAH